MEKDINQDTIIPVDYSNWKNKLIPFLTGQNISLFGSALVQYVIIWYITLVTTSGSMMTIATVCAFLPQIIIGLFSGVWADRYNRKYIIILADSMIALTTLVVSILFLIGYQEIWLLFVVLSFRSLGAGVQSPAVSALIPQLVPMDKLMKVNGVNGSMRSLILLLSPAAGGLILTYLPLEIALFVDIVTAIVGISLFLPIKIDFIRKVDLNATSYLKDLAEGLKYIWNNHLVKTIIIFFGLFYFAITPAAMLTPLMITRNYGSEVWRLTLNEIAFSGGAIIGGAIIAAWGGFKNRLFTIAFASVLIGVLNILLGFKIYYVVYTIFMLFTGIIVPLIGSPTVVLLQERIDKNIQGRVFGLFDIISCSAFPLGMLLFGPLADKTSIESLLIITGVFIIVLGFAILCNKKFISAGISDIIKNDGNAETAKTM